MTASAVIIVSYRTPSDVAGCLESLDSLQSEPPFIVYLCENGGSAAWNDLCATLLRGPCGPGGNPPSLLKTHFSRLVSLRLVRSGRTVIVGEAPENLGYAGGINSWLVPLLSTPGWDGCWILNPDAVVLPGAHAALVSEAISRNLGMVGSRVMWTSADPRIRTRGLAWMRGRASARAVDRGALGSDAPDLQSIEELLDAPSGVSLFLTRPCAKALAPLNEQYFLYFEDLDWGLRARRAGFRVGHAHDSVVNHIGGASIGSPSPDYIGSPLAIYLGFRNRILFVHDHYPSWWVWTVLISLVHAARLAPFGGFPAAAKGLLAGLRGEIGRPDRLVEAHKPPV